MCHLNIPEALHGASSFALPSTEPANSSAHFNTAAKVCYLEYTESSTKSLIQVTEFSSQLFGQKDRFY